MICYKNKIHHKFTSHQVQMVEAADPNDPCAGMNRAQIKDYCIQKADAHLAAKEGYEVQTDNPAKSLKIWLT